MASSGFVGIVWERLEDGCCRSGMLVPAGLRTEEVKTEEGSEPLTLASEKVDINRAGQAGDSVGGGGGGFSWRSWCGEAREEGVSDVRYGYPRMSPLAAWGWHTTE